MRQIIPIEINAAQNRRSLPQLLKSGEVQLRENLQVIGTGEEKQTRKVPGASRFSDSNTGTSYNSGIRYYSKGAIRKTFAFNVGTGTIYHISDNGTESVSQANFSNTAIPVWETMRISSNDVLYFSEGISTGMYSHDGNIGNSWVKETSVALNFVSMVAHLDRLFGVEEDSEDLYFSKNLEPTNFTDSTDAGVITIGAKRGSKIIGIAILYGTMFIFKQDSIWKLIGRTPSEFEVIEVNPHLGAGARRSIINTDTGLIFLGSDYEFYGFGGTIDSTILLSYNIAIGGDLTKNLIPIINKTKMASVVGTYHNKIYRCSFVENGQTANNIEWCFDTVNQIDFFTRGFNISCYIRWDRFPDANELLTGRTDLGRLMRMNIGLNVDNGASSPFMRFRLKTKAILNPEPRNARFKRLFLNAEVLGAAPVKIFTYVDGRYARSDAGEVQMETSGEVKTQIGPDLMSQKFITSRVNLPYGTSKGRSFELEIDTQARDIDFGITKFEVETVVGKQVKKNERVAV